MTVVEYEDRIVVVDVGLRFPTAEMLGIDLVLPDFTYLRERVDDIEAIVITHGHEDHLGALPWVLRELGVEDAPPVYGGPLTMAMARSKLDEHRLRDVELQDVDAGETHRARPVRRRAGPHDALDPRRRGGRADVRPRDRAVTGDYKFDQTPVDGAPGRRRRAWPSSAATGCCCSAATRRTPTARASRRARRSSARTSRRSSAAARAASSSPASPRTSTASSRSSTPPRRSGARSRSSAARCARTSNIGRSLGHIEVPDGILVQPREIDDFPDEKLVIISTGSQGEPLARCAAWPTTTTRRSSCTRATPSSSRATPIPGNERAVNETIDRLFHIGCDVITTARRADPRLRPRLRRGDQADAQPHAAALRDAVPRRPQAHPPARRARRGGRHRRRTRSSAARTACRWRSTSAARASASASSAGMIFVDGVDIGDVDRRRAARPPDALRRRHLRRRRDDLRAGRLSRSPSPRSSSAACRSPTRPRSCSTSSATTVERSLERGRRARRSARSTSSSRCSTTTSRAFVYDRLKRRPMVLPVVVEV